ncbi:MAG: hypothetical protein HQL31_10905, partial [Planctomycetes bacterium]|nr:hypothetical protein [Planctomycetota bacterium]
GMPREALAHLKLAKEQGIKGLALRMSRCHLQLDQPQQGLALLEGMGKNEGETQLLKAEILLRLERFGESLVLLEKLENEDPAAGRISFLAGQCSYRLDRLSDARTHFGCSRLFAAYRSISLKYLILIACSRDEKEEAALLVQEGQRMEPGDSWFRDMAQKLR